MLSDEKLLEIYQRELGLRDGWQIFAGLRAVAEAAVKDERENRNRPMALREFAELVQKLVIIGPLTSEQGRQLMMLQEMASTTLEAAVKDAVSEDKPKRDWPEAANLMRESIYQIRCVECRQLFMGWKRRPVCAVCARPQASAAVPECEWFPDSDMDNMPDTWQGGCGAVWSFIDGGPVENEMKFCPHCGGRVHISASQPEVK